MILHPLTILHPLPLHPAVAGGGGGTVDLPGGAEVAGRGDIVDDDKLRFARARELELAFRAPPFAGRAHLSRHWHVVHMPVRSTSISAWRRSNEWRRPRGAFRRGDWYARKETRHRDETYMAHQRWRANTVHLCVESSFQDDYQSSCGMTTACSIANLSAFVRKTCHTPCRRPHRDTSRQTITRSGAAGMTAKS